MSLYHHGAGKDALIDAMVDEVVGEIAVPRRRKDWRAEMRRRARSALVALKRHSWVCPPMMVRANVGSRMLTYLDRPHGYLLGARFSHEGADRTRHLLDSHIHGFTLREWHFQVPPQD